MRAAAFLLLLLMSTPLAAAERVKTVLLVVPEDAVVPSIAAFTQSFQQTVMSERQEPVTVNIEYLDMAWFESAGYERALCDLYLVKYWEQRPDVIVVFADATPFLKQHMRASGEAGIGPGHHALGLGQLALGEPARARERLEQVLVAGYESASLEYALGRALGELYRRALKDTRRITRPGEREKKVALLDQELRAPALCHLQAAMGARLEIPE